ncbi:STAS domain-containing protein [Myxococcaceae bacterium GXIMD 01537]
MELTRTDTGDKTTLTLAGQLNVNTAPSLRQMVGELEAGQRNSVTLEVSSLTDIDSSGIAAIIALHNQLRRTGGTLDISGLQGQPRAMFKLLRLDTVFSL